MTEFTPIGSIIGGALIGFAAVILFRFNGRIAGVSGIMHGLFTQNGNNKLPSILFLLGLIIGGLLYAFVSGEPLTASAQIPFGLLILGGVAVGIGTRLGNGCTSGHGVCGLARFSVRSLAAVLTFLLIGMASATLLHGFWLQ